MKQWQINIVIYLIITDHSQHLQTHIVFSVNDTKCIFSTDDYKLIYAC